MMLLNLLNNKFWCCGGCMDSCITSLMFEIYYRSIALGVKPIYNNYYYDIDINNNNIILTGFVNNKEVYAMWKKNKVLEIDDYFDVINMKFQISTHTLNVNTNKVLELRLGQSLKIVERLLITIPCLYKLTNNNIIELKDNAFRNEDNLAEFHSDTVRKIGKDCFFRCLNLRKISVPNCAIIRESAFSNNFNLDYVDISSCKILNRYLFGEDSNLRVCLAKSAVRIEDYVFSFCSRLEEYCFGNIESLSSDALFQSNLREEDVLNSSCKRPTNSM